MWWRPSFFSFWMTCCGCWQTLSSKPSYITPNLWARPWRSQLSRERAWLLIPYRFDPFWSILTVSLYLHLFFFVLYFDQNGKKGKEHIAKLLDIFCKEYQDFWASSWFLIIRYFTRFSFFFFTKKFNCRSYKPLGTSKSTLCSVFMVKKNS